MLTERERAVKDALVRELGGLSYAERRGILDDVDTAFLEEGIRTIRRQQRWRKWMGAACFVYLSIVAAAVGLKLGLWTPPLLLLIGVVWVLVYLHQYQWFERRLMTYRLLQALAPNGREDPERPGGPEQGPT